MDKIRYTVTHNYDDPTLTQTFNADGREFPDLIYSQTSFELLHRAKKWDDFDNQNVVAMDLTSMTAANLYIKPKNNVLTPTSIATGSVVGAATDGIILFTVDKDVISNSLAQFTTDSNPTPIVLYLVIESSDNGKFSLETDIRIMDINRDGNNEATTFEAATIGYTPEQSAKWTSQYWSSPTGTAEALDKLARVDHTDRGSIISQLATPPGSPADGDKYLVIATGTGDWVGLEDSLVEWNSTAGSWLAHTPREGDEFYDKNLNDRYRYNGSAWVLPGVNLPVDDTTSLVQDPVDNTKQTRLDTGAVSTGTTRVLTMPDQDIDLTPGTGAFATAAEGDLAATALQDLVDDTTPQLGGDLSANGHQIQWSKGADVASSAALALGTDGNSFDITGTTTITSINTIAIGTYVMLHFDGALTLTHNATDLILPGAANITTAAGDIATFYEYATGDWRCVSYQVAATAPGGGGGAGSGFPSTDNDKTAAYTVVAGDVGENIVFSGLSADVDCTLDVSLLSLGDILGVINEDSTYSVRVVVSNTSTMTLGSTKTDQYLWQGETVLFGGDTSTNARFLARP